MSNPNFEQMVEAPTAAPPTRRGLELRRRPDALVVGGLPTVSLLPREFKAAARDKTIRRLLIGAMVVALVVAGGATAGSTLLSGAAQNRLDAANLRSQQLITQLAKFQEVQSLEQSISLGRSAKTVGASTEIDWQAQIDAIKQDMPSGYAVTTIVADSASPLVGYPQGATPLEQPRAASLALTVTSPSITALPIWLRKIRSIPAYADATATVSSEQNAGYSTLITVHLSPKALITAKATK